MVKPHMQTLELVSACLIAICLAGCAIWLGRDADAVGMNTITGTVTYQEQVALPAGALLSVRLENVSQQDATAALVSEVTFQPQQPVPIPYALEYDPQSIDDRLSYAVRASIRRGDEPLFVSDNAIPVLTRGNGNEANFVLVASSSALPPAELTGTRWQLRRLGGKKVAAASDDRAPYLQLEGTPPDLAVSGHGSCNTFRGTAKQDGGALQFGPLASTKMACPDMQRESSFHRALEATRSWEIRDGRLVLSGPDGELAGFESAE